MSDGCISREMFEQAEEEARNRTWQDASSLRRTNVNLAEIADLLDEDEEDLYYCVRTYLITNFKVKNPDPDEMNKFFFEVITPYRRALRDLFEEHQKLVDAIGVMIHAVGH